MTTIEELEALATDELRERAFDLARRKLDARFFWDLLEAVPAVEAAAGHEHEAEEDILSFSARVADLIKPDTAEEADAFRPIYIDYVIKNEGGS